MKQIKLLILFGVFVYFHSTLRKNNAALIRGSPRSNLVEYIVSAKLSRAGSIIFIYQSLFRHIIFPKTAKELF